MQPVVVPEPPDQEKETSSPDHWISMPEPVHEPPPPPPPPLDDGLDAGAVVEPTGVTVSVGWVAEAGGAELVAGVDVALTTGSVAVSEVATGAVVGEGPGGGWP